MSDEMLENKIELLEEDIEAYHMAMDKLNVPRSLGESDYSMFGRALVLSKMNRFEKWCLNEGKELLKVSEFMNPKDINEITIRLKAAFEAGASGSSNSACESAICDCH